MTTTDDFTLRVRALWDGTQLDAGTKDAAASVDGLEAAVKTSTASMDASLKTLDTGVQTTLGSSGTFVKSADETAVGLTSRTSKFKAVGSDLGASVAQGAASGLSGPEQIANVGQSLASLLAFTGVGGAIAAVGVGLGTKLITDLIAGVDAKAKEFTEAFNDLFSAVEVEAEDSMREVKKSILDAFTFEQALEELGGEDGLAGGLRKVESLVAATGVEFNDIVDIIRGKINPANQNTRTLLKQQADETEKIAAGKGGYIEQRGGR